MAIALGTLVTTLGVDTSDLNKAERHIGGVAKTTTAAFKRVGLVIAAAISVETARRVLLIADNMQILERRLVRFTGSAENARTTLAQLVKTASDTGSAIADTASQFERFSMAREELGATNSEIIQLVDTMSKLGAIGGSSAVELSQSLRQMSQSFAGGVVRAEEFNSIIDSTPEIARAMAREMGLSMGELRKRMLEGKLTAQDVFQAMLSASESANVEFDKLPKSIEKVTQALVNELSVAIGNADEGLGFSAAVSTAISDLARLVGKINEASAAAEKMQSLIGPEDQAADVGFILGAIGKIPGARLLTQGVQAMVGPTAAERTPEQQQARDMNDLLKERVRLQGMVNTMTATAASGRDTTSLGLNEFGLPTVKSLADRSAELDVINKRIRDLRASSPSAAAFQDISGGLGAPSGTGGLGNPSGLNPILNPQLGGSMPKPARDATDKETAAVEAIRRLGETERAAIERESSEALEFVKTLDFKTAAERSALADMIAAERLAQLAALQEREIGQLAILGESERETINREAVERRDLLLAQTQLTADEIKALQERIETERLARIKDVDDTEIESARRKAQELARIKRGEADLMLTALNATSNAISGILAATGNSAAARAASIISSVGALASTIAIIMAAQAKAQALGDPTAITLPQKIANVAIMTGQFVGIFAALKGAKGGGRAMGGATSGSLAHPINERGTPEILTQGGRQFLLPTGKGGNITPMKSGAGGGGQANVTIISNGTPQTVTGTQVSRDEIVVMINDAGKQTERKINGSLQSGRGDTAQALQKGFQVSRNLA